MMLFPEQPNGFELSFPARTQDLRGPFARGQLQRIVIRPSLLERVHLSKSTHGYCLHVIPLGVQTTHLEDGLFPQTP
jgi:hypothetical protein